MPADDDSALAGTEVHYLRSEHVGDELKLFVAHCDETEAPVARDAPPVVLYPTDANGQFGGAVDLVRYLQLNAWLPPMLVVGLGYRAAGIASTIPFRNRDLTPTRDDAWSRDFSTGSPTGGAPRFLAAIREEVQPWVGARFGAGREGSTFFGHSSGGLFATYVLLTAPGTFANYAVASPSYWWDSGVAFALEEEYARIHTDLVARVFVATGEHEDQRGRERAYERMPPAEQAKPRARHIDFVADAARMAGALRGRGYAGLELENVVLAGEYHNTVPQVALSRALRWLFGAPG